MIELVYEVIDKIDSNQIIKKLDDIKTQIKNDDSTTKLIKRFEEAKELYTNYNLKDEFLIAKTNLLNNDLIKSFVEIQNEINMLALYINKKIDKLTEDTIHKI